MKITEIKLTVRDIVNGYEDDEEKGVRGYGGKLDIRPPYQREFIYDKDDEEAVIHSVMHGYPLNVMYWCKRDSNAEVPYEILDGQQRTLSLCQYVNEAFSYVDDDGKAKYFSNFTPDKKKKLLDYQLTIYVCEGTDTEKLAWFRIINMKKAELTEQEINNAVYAGPFVSDAKRHFSKTGCAASKLSQDILSGSPIRQQLLQKALQWMVDHEGREGNRQTIVQYMAKHQADPNASLLWNYFQSVCHWALDNFDVHKLKPVMKDIDWAWIYDNFSKTPLDNKANEARILDLMGQGKVEIQNPKGIIPYVLTGDEQQLNLRAFPKNIRIKVYNKQGGKCAICGKSYPEEFMEADHIIPWSKGGRTVEENCQMLCRECNRKKSNK